jgi:alcohol oxidase
MHVSSGSSTGVLADQFITAAKEYGFKWETDLQGFQTIENKVSHLQKYINPHNGTRSDAATGYLGPLEENYPNLRLLVQTKVSKVQFQGNRAVGVSYIAKYISGSWSQGTKLIISKRFDESADQTPRFVRARKLVVLSAGALATPQILQRSGVGDAEKLEHLGIDRIISNLPQVGQNLSDHPHFRTPSVHMDVKPEDTADFLLRIAPEELATLLEDFQKNKGGRLSTNFVDAGMKLRPSDEVVKSLGPEFERWWKEDFANKPDKPVVSLQLFGL